MLIQIIAGGAILMVVIVAGLCIAAAGLRNNVNL
jgi:hypothetical protein